MKNYLDRTLGLAALVLLFLTGLSWIPDGLTLGGLPLRKVDIFSDIRAAVPVLPGDSLAHDSLLPGIPDSLLVGDTIEHPGADSLGLIPVVDPALFGQIFEDYTPQQQGLDRFFAAIDSIHSFNRTVRIAFFGDSFVEGDILLGDLRDTLQTRWGGDGVGYVPITSEVARFKRTLVHEYGNWNTYSIVKNHNSNQPFGINGFVYRPKPEAFVRYEGANYFRHTRQWSRLRLFYQSARNAPFIWQDGGMMPRTDTLAAGSGALQVWTRTSPFSRSFELRFEHPDSMLLLYGATLESGPGIYIDNFSVRGNTGGRLRLIKPDLAHRFDAFQHYDLIIVQLGLNAVTPHMNNIQWYRSELDQTFAHLRKCFPGKPILVISVADRAGKVNGELATLPSVPAITEMQRDLARHYGFLFYDLYHGMGGPGSMIRLVAQKPALANKDYTHLTHEGGRVMGYMFARLFLEAQAGYQRASGTAPLR